MNRCFHKRVLATALSSALALSGCATPYVVKLPDSKVASTSRSIEKALEYMHATRQVYRHAIEGQLNNEQTASNAFIGAGALITALALGKVHRDGVLGVAALAGTGYALTNNNLPRSRLQIHVESLKALNCAERAVLPLAISDDEKLALSEAAEKLRESRQQLVTELRVARVVRDKSPEMDVWRKGFLEAEAAVNEILTQTAQSLTAAEAFQNASDRAAINLVSWVNTIRDNSITSLAEARSPLAEVPRLINGLAKDMGTFAPGAGVDSLLVEALKRAAVKNVGGPASSNVGSKSELELALDELDKVAHKVAALQSPVNTALRGRNTTFADDAFKDCNVAQVVTALAVTPTPLKFSAQAGGQRVLELKGGVKPYFLQLDGGPVVGLSYPTGPIRGGEAEISLKAGALTSGAKTGLRASDSSAAGQGVRIEIEIVAEPAAPSAPAPAASAAEAPAPNVTDPKTKPVATKTGVDAALSALKKLGKFASGGATFERKGLPVKAGDRIEITVICPATGAAVFKRADLTKSYLSAAGVSDFAAEKVSLTTEPPTCAPS